MGVAHLALTREQILNHRRHVGALNRRLPPGPESLRRAAWAGLQDSMPRAALLSIHARVDGATHASWEDPSLVQLWGPRFGAYVVAAPDLPVFGLGRLPSDAKGRRIAEDTAAKLDAFLKGRRMQYGAAGAGIGVHPNSLRYGAATGRIVIRWEGARAPTVWTVPAHDMDPLEARLELARRYLHVYGPTTPTAFRRWAGIGTRDAREAFERLASEVTPVGTPIGDASILSSDEATFRQSPDAPADAARLLPSGDAYFLLHGVDRELLVPEADRRARLWTPRVWPGAVMLAGELVGTWRRADADLSVEPWQPLAKRERGVIEAEAATLPLPSLRSPISVRWLD